MSTSVCYFATMTCVDSVCQTLAKCDFVAKSDIAATITSILRPRSLRLLLQERLRYHAGPLAMLDNLTGAATPYLVHTECTKSNVQGSAYGLTTTS